LVCSKTDENVNGIMTRKKKNYVQDLIGESIKNYFILNLICVFIISYFIIAPESVTLQKMTTPGPVSIKGIKHMPKLADQVRNVLTNGTAKFLGITLSR